MQFYNLIDLLQIMRQDLPFLSIILFTFTVYSLPTVLPKLPLYVGKGYNILIGNPSSEGIDPGFQHEVLEFTYNKNVTTEDGKYLLPDGVSHRKTTACSFSTEINQYRGTQSYQNELKTKAQIGAGYNGILFKASFSQSISYQKLKNQTISQNDSLTHASAQCQYYQMSIDVFQPGKISSNFWTGVNYSYHQKDWEKFIQQFGSHYIHQVVYGGRAIQQIQYSSKSVSQMQAIGIDINTVAKASYAKFYADASFDYHKYDTEIRYSQTLSKSIKQIYIGGQPPRSGKVIDWQQSVIHDPMPVTYKMLPLSDLFIHNPDKTINQTLAKSQFLAALDHYCSLKNCKQPTPDKPKPAPATVILSKSNAYGGNGGSQFDWNKTTHPAFDVRKIIIRSGSEIDNIQVQLSDGISSVLSPQFGGQGGSLREQWNVPKDEYITQIQYRSGDRIDSLTFITNKGTKSPRYGGTGGSYHMETFPPNHRIFGLFGRDGSRLDKLGFVLGQIQYHSETPQVSIKVPMLQTE